jgi:hypothetical protein
MNAREQPNERERKAAGPSMEGDGGPERGVSGSPIPGERPASVDPESPHDRLN